MQACPIRAGGGHSFSSVYILHISNKNTPGGRIFHNDNMYVYMYPHSCWLNGEALPVSFNR